MTDPINLSINESARLAGCSPRKMRKLVWDRQIEFCKIGRRVLIPVAALEEFLKKNTVPVFNKTETLLGGI